MRKALKVTMKGTIHRWCIWHITHKFAKKLGKLPNYTQIHDDLEHVIYENLDREEFEINWRKVIKKHELEDDDWLQDFEEFVFCSSCLEMDRSWITTTKPGDPEYQQGVKEFIKFAFENSGGRSKLRCPCFMCHNFLHKRPDEILNHLNKWAFDRTYTHWIWHGERRDMHAGDSGETRDNVRVVHDVDEGD
ncbi:uncharacterized protein LOC110689097 [Chenopodium quinoa]|uniref:uncharacterized protein LOC110689097 n=1 Tax=Chenopodium quinoa TaxID=63459 RepID=UPI000B76E6CC|nr:uncharacterized protein LOC110689097 [Chenopodium quinoa]